LNKYLLALLAGLAAVPARAGGYIQQSTFPVSAATIAGLDRDLNGNLYVFGRNAGDATYRVTGYQTQGITPLFSFDTGVSSPAAFAVEDSGIVDIVDISSGFTLKRFTNVGSFVSQSTYALNTSQYISPQYLSATIDKATHRVYLAFQFTEGIYHLECIGCGTGPSSETFGFVNQYDLQGNALLSTLMPGNSVTAGSCYTPSLLTTDPQGDLYIADAVCAQIVEYSLAGTLTSSVHASQWTTNFQPRGMWTDASSNLYISEPVCGPAGCPWGIAKIASGALQTSFVADSAVGAAWDQRILYMPSSGGLPLRRFIYDGAPSVPAEAGPIGPTTQHSSAAALSWQTSSDADGDPITYSVYLGTNPTQLVNAGSTTVNALSSQPLNFGTTYYWQVMTQDSYLGLPLQQTPAPVESFNLSFVNNPPAGFAVSGGTGTLITRNAAATLTWQTSTDPDGDPVLYDVSWRPAAQSSATVITTADTSLVMPGLTIGSTYFWSVKARDSYGASTAMTGGTQALQLVFKNSPPSTVAYLNTSSSYSLHTTAPSIALSWAPASDPDGDAVSYQLDVQTSTGTWPPIPLGSATSFTLGAQLETAYSWRVEAADAYGGVSTAPWSSFVVHLSNRPPNPIVYTSSGSVTTRAASFSLAWQDTGDPENDAVSYGVYASTDPAFQPLVQQGGQTGYTLALQFGATLYWRVSATDSFGARTDGPIQTLLPVFKNSPPPAPNIVSGTGLVSEHDLPPSAHFAWSSVLDPDGDSVAYQLSIGTSSANLASVQFSTQTSYDLLGAQFGSTYYWQVSAIDSYGAASASPVQSLLLSFQDSPPNAFAVLTGTGTLATRTTSQLLTWGAAVDPDGDSVTYALALSTSPSPLPVVQLTSATSYALGVQFGTTYYWTVSAYDSFGGTTAMTGGTQSFVPTFLNQAPQIVQLMPPFDGSPTITTMRGSAAVSWNQVTTPQNDPVTYTVYLGNAAGDVQPLAQIGQTTQAGSTALSLRPMAVRPQAQVQMNGNTITLTLTGLDYYRSYYIRIQAQNPYGATSLTPIQTFTIASANGFPPAYNYPNPFSPLRGGTNLVFNAPGAGYARATVSVYSELGDLLVKRDYQNIAPGISQVPFDGRDRFGRPLFNGSYVCRVRFEGPDAQSTFYLLVVK
jgi:hypothetical protein